MKQKLLCLTILTVMASTGMAAEKPAPKRPLQVGILLFPGVELLDFAGPAEVFIVAGHGEWFEVHTIAASTKPLKTMGQVTVTPSHSFQNAPKLDILVVPGGALGNVEDDGIEWIRKASKTTKITMSVCMGAFLLAEAGKLDGLEVTTHHWGTASLQRRFPKCTVVEGKRFVDSGKIVTTAGVTAGIDGALHIVKRLRGEAGAKWTAEEWMEYRLRKPEKENPRPSSADTSTDR